MKLVNSLILFSIYCNSPPPPPLSPLYTRLSTPLIVLPLVCLPTSLAIPSTRSCLHRLTGPDTTTRNEYLQLFGLKMLTTIKRKHQLRNTPTEPGTRQGLGLGQYPACECD